MKNKIYLAAFSTAIISAAFSLFVIFNIAASNARIKASDPLNSKSIEQMRSNLWKDPGNEELKNEIRDLDLLIRKAYFTNLSFTSHGAWMLLCSLAVLLVSLKVLTKFSARPPIPGKFEEKDDSMEHAALARESIAIAFSIILAVVAFAALTSSSLLDKTLAKKKPIAPAAGIREEMVRNWPCFRGMDGIGIAHYTNAPTAWDGKTGKNVIWKKPVPGKGHSSPVVWGKKVFFSYGDKKSRHVICYNGDTGEILWDSEVGVVPGTPAELPEIMEDTTFAAPTMATDGRYVFAIYATGNVAAFDFEGKKIWVRHLLNIENTYGHAGSLVTHKDLLFIQLDDDNGGRIFALDTATGKTRWADLDRKLHPSWTSPIIAKTGKETFQLVCSGHPLVIGYEAETGKKLWQVKCMGGELTPSPAYSDGITFVASEYERLAAIQMAPEAKIIWEYDEDLPDVSSPVASGKYLLLSTASGIITCFEAKTGKKLWMKEFDDGYYSSPVLVGKNIYLMDMKGNMRIFELGDTYKEIAIAKLGEKSNCVPAFMDGRIYIRGEKNIYCIGTK